MPARFTIRPSAARGGANHGWLHTFHTFSFADYHDPEFNGFGPLRVLNEDFVQPGRGFGAHQHQYYEIFSYVVHGALEHRDSMGNVEKVGRSWVQHTSAGTGLAHSEMNASKSERVHFLQLWAQPWQARLKPNFALKSFPDEKKVGTLLPLMAPALDCTESKLHDAAVSLGDSVIRLNQDLFLFATIFLANGEGPRSVTHTPHAPAPKSKRKLYIHVVMDDESDGVVVNGNVTLKPGDGLFVDGILAEEKLDIVAASAKRAEFILLDMTPEGDNEEEVDDDDED
ncbi:RmlC-like cupin domain-containing protein [Cladochytrium replicatum]|nr:RmlC-like cupin domain-containing protein [Cladochytrium replicatum]